MTARPHGLTIAGAGTGFALAAVALFIDAHTLLLCYLATVVTISAIPIGALAVLMISYLVRGYWTEGLHAPLAAAALTMPVMGLLFVPILVGIPWLYPWTRHMASDAGTLQLHYLVPWLFVVRTVIYFAIWTALAIAVVRAWGNPRRMIALASAGLILYAITASFAGIDWLESLTPEFHSSIYGLLFLTFQLLTAFSFALVVALSRPDAPTFRYGAILLAVLLLWAYNHAMQYIVIWSANIPEETVWYTRREAGLWGAVFWSLIVLQFILPFFALLSARVRNERRLLLVVAGATLLLRFMEAIVLVMPSADLAWIALLFGMPGTLLAVAAIGLMSFRMARSYLAVAGVAERSMDARLRAARARNS
jgi:hypothetical protein